MMALKDMMDPGRIIGGLVEKMGLTPEIIRDFVNEIWTEFRAQKADRLAFRAACQRVVPDITARLERIEARQDEIMARLALLGVEHATRTLLPRPGEPATRDERAFNGHD